MALTGLQGWFWRAENDLETKMKVLKVADLMDVTWANLDVAKALP